MDLLLWLSDPVRYESDISAAYWDLVYGAVQNFSNYLTQMGYPPR